MNTQVDSSLSWMLAEVARLMRKLADRRLEPLGLTRAQWQALAYMRRQGPLTQSALADVIEVETATVAPPDRPAGGRRLGAAPPRPVRPPR